MISLIEFKHNASDWLQKNLEVAPPNYGAILPPALEKEGGEVAVSPQEAADRGEILITSLPSLAALETVIGGEDGIIHGGREGQILIDTCTLKVTDKVTQTHFAFLIWPCPDDHGPGPLGSLVGGKDIALFENTLGSPYTETMPM